MSKVPLDTAQTSKEGRGKVLGLERFALCPWAELEISSGVLFMLIP